MKKTRSSADAPASIPSPLPPASSSSSSSTSGSLLPLPIAPASLPPTSLVSGITRPLPSTITQNYTQNINANNTGASVNNNSTNNNNNNNNNSAKKRGRGAVGNISSSPLNMNPPPPLPMVGGGIAGVGGGKVAKNTAAQTPSSTPSSSSSSPSLISGITNIPSLESAPSSSDDGFGGRKGGRQIKRTRKGVSEDDGMNESGTLLAAAAAVAASSAASSFNPSHALPANPVPTPQLGTGLAGFEDIGDEDTDTEGGSSGRNDSGAESVRRKGSHKKANLESEGYFHIPIRHSDNSSSKRTIARNVLLLEKVLKRRTGGNMDEVKKTISALYQKFVIPPEQKAPAPISLLELSSKFGLHIKQAEQLSLMVNEKLKEYASLPIFASRRSAYRELAASKNQSLAAANQIANASTGGGRSNGPLLALPASALPPVATLNDANLSPLSQTSAAGSSSSSSASSASNNGFVIPPPVNLSSFPAK